MNKLKDFDFNEIVMTDIKPFAEQIEAICSEHGIPFLLAICSQREGPREIISTLGLNGDQDNYSITITNACREVLTKENREKYGL